MKKILVLFILLFTTPLFGQDLFLPFLTVFDWISCDSLITRVAKITSTLELSGSVSGGATFDKLIVTDSTRNEGTLRQKGESTFGATATPVTISGAGVMTFTNNKWLQWKNTSGIPTGVFKWSNGNAITFNSAAIYLLPDATGALQLGSAALGFRGVFIDGKKTSANLAEFGNDKNGGLGDSASTINSKAQFVSGVPVGTAPFQITSTTVVTNLNADMLDGVHIAGVVRSSEVWVYYNSQNPSLVSLPADAKVLSVEMWVQEAFNSDGTDNITVGYDATTNAYGTAVDVSTTGVKTVTLGATAKTVDATARSVEVYYVNGGTEPTTGFAHISITWIQASTIPQP